jgi:hypothetical protein
MMLLPGCAGAKRISSNPLVGPLASSRRSLLTRVSVIANARRLAEKSAASPMFCTASNRLPLLRRGSPVSALSRATMRG